MAPFNKVTFSGTLPGGETWSTGVAFASFTSSGYVDSFEELQEWANAIALLNAGNVFPVAWRSALSAAAAITKIRCEFYFTQTVLGQAAERDITPKPGIGAAGLPFQNSLVMSLLTGRPGRSYRGRMYLPAIGASVDPATLTLGTPNTEDTAVQGAGFLLAISDAAPGDLGLSPAVHSQLMDLNTRVTTVSVGNILDTQRRRRASVPEVYFTASV